MSILATAKTNIPSKVHYTQYIVTEDEPKESRAGTLKRLEQLTPHRLILFMRAIVRTRYAKR